MLIPALSVGGLAANPWPRMDEMGLPFRKVTRSFQKVTRSVLKVTRSFRKVTRSDGEMTRSVLKVTRSDGETTRSFRLFPAKGRPRRRRDAASPPLSHLAFLVISLIAFDAGNFGSSNDTFEDITTEDTETPSAARKAADEDYALRRKPSLIRGIMEDKRAVGTPSNLFNKRICSRLTPLTIPESRTP